MFINIIFLDHDYSFHEEAVFSWFAAADSVILEEPPYDVGPSRRMGKFEVTVGGLGLRSWDAAH